MQLRELLAPPCGPRVHGDRSTLQGDARANFAVNLNPFGTPAELVRAAASADLEAYPDPSSAALRRTFAEWLDRSPDEFVFDAGACPLLWAAARLLHPRGTGAALIIGPTFSEYAAAVQSTRAKVFELAAEAACGFEVDLEAIAAARRTTRATSIYLCNPNNPTGKLLPHAAVAELAERIDGCPLVLDESFMALTPAWRELHDPLPCNVFRVRSLTKEYALAGLRLGVASGKPEWVRAIESGRAPWAVSAPAQAAGLALPGLEDLLRRQRADLLQLAESLEAGLLARGIHVYPGAANFRLALLDQPDATHAALGRHGVEVRDCSSFGLPAFVRLAARPLEEQALLFDALDSIEALSTGGAAR